MIFFDVLIVVLDLPFFVFFYLFLSFFCLFLDEHLLRVCAHFLTRVTKRVHLALTCELCLQ